MKRVVKWANCQAVILGIVIAGCGLGDPAPARVAGERSGEAGTLAEEGLGEVTQAVTATFTPGPTAKFIPPRVGSGDAEFKGHGPNVTVDATLSVRNQTEVWARVHMNAIETQADWTQAEGTTDVFLYRDTLPIRILSDTFSADSYTDTNHSDDTLAEAPGELVNHFLCSGDTDGSEAGTRTGVRVFWNAITVEQIRDSCVNHCGGSSGSCFCDARRRGVTGNGHRVETMCRRSTHFTRCVRSSETAASTSARSVVGARICVRRRRAA